MSTQTVRDMVINDYRTADVFKKWGINYCCGGDLPLNEVCVAKSIDADTLKKDLDDATKMISISNAVNFSRWPVIFLVDYIVYVHHAYLRMAVPVLTQHITSFVSGHLKKYPYLAGVQETFLNLAGEMMEQANREEEKIFPYLKQISNTYDRKEEYGSLFVKTLGKPLSDTIQKDQTRAAALLDLLREQTNHYRFSPEACTNHQVIYHKLKELDADLVQHKHLENNILFPKLLHMEKELLQL